MLRVLYVIAIGLLFAGFVGFGVATFYPAPDRPTCVSAEPTIADGDAITTDREALKECDLNSQAFERQNSDYQRTLTLIFLAAAVVIISVSIFGLGNIEIIGDGITLGGVILLFASLVASIASGSAMFRFITVTAGLAIVLFLSYWKFVRSPKPPVTL